MFAKFAMPFTLVCTSIILIASRALMAEAALCQGKVTFYWRELGKARVEEERNWGRLEKKLGGSRSSLEKYFDPKAAYATTVEGDCCWEVYSEEKFEGDSAKLKSGFSGIPRYPQFYAKSLKKLKEC